MRCTFTLVPGLKTLQGAVLESHSPFVFDTGGPAVIETRPWTGSSDIDEHQAFILVLDAEPVEQTVLDHAEFAVHGMAQRVGVRIVSGADRDLLLKRFDDFINHRPAIILQARQEFPDNADVKLIWGKGIATTSGIATAQDSGNQLQGAPRVRGAIPMRARECASRVHPGNADVAFVFGADIGGEREADRDCRPRRSPARRATS